MGGESGPWGFEKVGPERNAIGAVRGAPRGGGLVPKKGAIMGRGLGSLKKESSVPFPFVEGSGLVHCHSRTTGSPSPGGKKKTPLHQTLESGNEKTSEGEGKKFVGQGYGGTIKVNRPGNRLPWKGTQGAERGLLQRKKGEKVCSSGVEADFSPRKKREKKVIKKRPKEK